MAKHEMTFPISLDYGDFDATVCLSEEYYERIRSYIQENCDAIEDGCADAISEVEDFEDIFGFIDRAVAGTLADSIHDDPGAYEDLLEEDGIDMDDEEELTDWVQDNVSFYINWPSLDEDNF